MYVRTYVCMYVCMYVCAYACMYVYMYIHMHLSTYIRQVRSVVAPRSSRGGYYVVYGEPGVGKSTLLKQAAREAGENVLYVDVGRVSTYVGR